MVTQWQGTKQREHQVDPIQIQYATALPTAVYSGIAAILVDGVLADNSGFLKYRYSTGVLVRNPSHRCRFLPTPSVALTLARVVAKGMILTTCVLAMAVNTLSYALIGQTSSVTYQVVGHGTL